MHKLITILFCIFFCFVDGEVYGSYTANSSEPSEVQCDFGKEFYDLSHKIVKPEKLPAFANNNPDFSDVLLIINYNHPHYVSVDFLRKLYSPMFPNIVFYGEREHPGVIPMQHQSGKFGHEVILDAMIKWPEYNGYLCVQDDCFMNFWNYSRFDKNKIWTTPPGVISIDMPIHSWAWWNKSFGRDAMIEVFPKLSESERSMLAQNVGPNNVGYTFHDFVYIPGRLREAFVEICPKFLNPPVFVELALQTMLLALDPIDNRENLKVHWEIYNIEKNYNPALDWIHPIKFSNKKNRKFIKSIVDKWKKIHKI